MLDDGEESLGLGSFCFGERCDPLLDFGLGRPVRIEGGVLRFLRRTEDERLVLVEARPRAFVDAEIMQAGAAFGCQIARQVEEHGNVASPDLAQKEAVDDLRGFNELHENFPVVRGEFRDVGGEIGRCEPCSHLLETGGLGSGGIGLGGTAAPRAVPANVIIEERVTK